ncbi:MAG: phytanoyl-CoA dioxygenase family protein [Bacteroidia bacterium]
MSLQNQLTIKAPTGEDIQIPVSVDDTTDVYLQLKTDKDIKDYYEDNGYVIIRNLIPAEACDEARKNFKDEVIPHKGFIYRQASGNPEKHKMTEHNYMLNSILNVQSVSKRHFPGFRATGIKVLTDPKMLHVLKVIMDDDPKLVQSMYFDGNPSTWAHQDTYYLDSEQIGRMVASWIALEDIQPGAGRFYVYPTSHKIDIQKNGGNFDIAFHHDRYKQLIKDIIKKFNLKCTAPAVRKGDVIFWHGKTIHGSLETAQPQYSRASYTGHFIPESTRFLQYQSVIKPLTLQKVNGINVNFPKDLSSLKNQMILTVETTFPKTFQFVKKLAIKMVTK